MSVHCKKTIKNYWRLNMSDLSYVCKKGLGIIYGNVIRQIALKGTDTWKPIAYNMGLKSSSVGMQGNLNFNTIQVFSATLKQIAEVPTTPEVRLEMFRKKGNIYASQSFEIHGLSGFNVESFEAYLHYTSGSYSVEDNASFIQNNLDVSIENLICVSSRHSEAISVTFTIEPVDELSERLIFTCDTKPIYAAIKSIKNTFAMFDTGGDAV